MKIKLHWEPLQHYTKLGDVDKQLSNMNRAGLYIWGFKNNDKESKEFWPYYVGKHRNVPFRLSEHLCNLRGGNYRIYDAENLFNLKEDHCIYSPVCICDKVQFVVDSFDNKKMEHVQYMIDRFYFTYCILSDFVKHGSQAEKTILNCFSRSLLVNRNFGKSCQDMFDIDNLFDVSVIHINNQEWLSQEYLISVAKQ